MNIERLNENQIRCTLYKSDLADKDIRLSELAYGTEKAKELFRELMQEAADRYGFEADNVPLMIEAIPVSQEQLILIITKVEDPDELDTRFSKFTAPAEEFYEEEAEEEEPEELIDMGSDGKIADKVNNVADGILNALKHIEDTLNQRNKDASAQQTQAQKKESTGKTDGFRIYAFKSLDQIIFSARLVSNLYVSDNTLYKNEKDSRFYLLMSKNKNTEQEFVQTCNVMGEYGVKQKVTYATPTHMEEHYKIIIRNNALQTLADL